MKNIFRILIILLSIFIIGVFYLSYLYNNNQEYLTKITTDIQENYSLDDEITSINSASGYYIITTTNNVIVLNKDYQEVLKENISILKKDKALANYPLIYKNKQLLYENTILKGKEVTYEYYDAKTGEKLTTTTLEKQ